MNHLLPHGYTARPATTDDAERVANPLHRVTRTLFLLLESGESGDITESTAVVKGDVLGAPPVGSLVASS
jgi:hypothetical protein